MMQAVSMKLHKKFSIDENDYKQIEEPMDNDSQIVYQAPRHKPIDKILKSDGYLKQLMLRKRYKKIECL